VKRNWAHIIILLCLPLIGLAQFSPGKLSEAHAHLEGMKNCTQCHELGSAVSETKCLDCHIEIQSLREADHGYHNSQEVRDKSCISCHSEHHGRAFDATRFDSTGFDHDLTGYLLEGAHVKVDCRKCHNPDYIVDEELGTRKGTYLGLEKACLSCHEDMHRGQLADDCLQCHQMDDWKPATLFDHNKTDYPLKGAHKQVECKECHVEKRDQQGLFAQYTNIAHQRCTDCHDDYHEGRLGSSCTDCHTIWSWNIQNASQTFDHSKTRYPLVGQHQEVRCEECHKNGYEAMPFARCTDCHEDFHEGDFITDAGEVTDCRECHSVEEPFTWSSYGIEEHQTSEYPLEGAHLATPCTACHMQEESEWSFAFNSHDCISCHNNVHEGSLAEHFTESNGCVDCHNTSSWSVITFDHNQTNYALEGLHTNVDCRGCHMPDGLDNQVFAPLSSACMDCHDDIHAGQFAVATNTPSIDCAGCHSTSVAWDPINFDHNNSRFPLEGKHAEAKCDACHKEELVNDILTVNYITNQLQCIDCHGS